MIISVNIFKLIEKSRPWSIDILKHQRFLAFTLNVIWMEMYTSAVLGTEKDTSKRCDFMLAPSNEHLTYKNVLSLLFMKTEIFMLGISRSLKFS